MDDVDTAAQRIEAHNDVSLRAMLDRFNAQLPGSGICRSCSHPIEPERLKANPKARECRECAQLSEEEAKRIRRRGQF